MKVSARTNVKLCVLSGNDIVVVFIKLHENFWIVQIDENIQRPIAIS